MSKREFVYVIYIQADAEKVWDGLTQPEFTRQYWWHDNVSDWKKGSKWEHVQSNDSRKVDIEGKVLENERPRRLVLSWVQPKHAGNPEETSRVMFEITDMDWPGGPWVQLKLTHSEMTDEMADSVSFGWPGVCSGLKTLIEKGTLGV